MFLRPIRSAFAVATVWVGVATPLAAQQSPPAPPQTKPVDTQKPDVPPRFEELVEVTASRDERPVLDAPATVNVLGSAHLTTLPATGYADALRSIPGLNIVEASAGDLRLSSRTATSLGGRSQLVLIDGRPLYIDFIGIPSGSWPQSISMTPVRSRSYRGPSQPRGELRRFPEWSM